MYFPYKFLVDEFRIWARFCCLKSWSYNHGAPCLNLSLFTYYEVNFGGQILFQTFIIKTGAAPGCLLREGKNASLLLRQPWKRSLSWGAGGGGGGVWSRVSWYVMHLFWSCFEFVSVRSVQPPGIYLSGFCAYSDFCNSFAFDSSIRYSGTGPVSVSLTPNYF